MPAHSPEDVDRLFGEYVNAGDLESLLALYEPDAVLAQPDGSFAAGHAAIRDSMAAFAGASMTIHMHVVRVARAGDVAMLYNDWSLTGTDPEGTAFEMTGKAIEVVRRQPDGTWKFSIDDPYARSQA